MMENTVSYALHAQTTGLADLQMFRAELAGLKDLQAGFRADMGFGQQQRESIKATKVDLSGLEFQILGLTDSIKVLDTTMDKLATKGPATAPKLKEPFQGLNPIIAETVRSVRTLLTEFQSGNIKAGEFNAGMSKAKTTLIQLRTENSLGTRELQAISGALNIVAKNYGLANSASSPYLAGLKAQRAAMNEVKATSAALNQEILGSRRAWQEGKIDSEQLALAMTSYGIRANALLAPLEAQKAAILALGVPTKAQSLELERLTGLTNGYSMAAQRAAAGVDAARGAITRGSLAAGVQAGTAGLSAALSQATADTKRLMDAERAGLVTKEQYILGLADQTAAHRAALAAIETEMTALRGMGQLDVQQTERLAQLVTAQNGYTAALARTVAAQQAQANAQRAAAGAALGVRGAGGMNNAAMGAMFISPELGMAAMALSMGPIIAGALAVGVLVKIIGDGIDKAAIFQRSLQQIGAISGQSAEQMNQYGTYIQHLSTELPISTQRLAEMGREAVMVGLHGPEGMRVYTETMAAFSVITRDANGNLGHTAEVGQEVVKILRSTGATTEEVTVGFGRMINGLVGLKTESGVAIPQVTALLKFWSSQGHAVGLTIEQMAGLSAALIQTGARAQGAGGAMAKFFDTAESAAATGGAKLQAWANVLGMSAEKAKELLKQDPMEFLRRFVTGAEEMDRNGKALSLTLGSVSLNSAQVRRIFAELVNALPLVTGNIKIMTDASNDQGMALRKAMEATNDYKDKVTLLSQGFDVLKTNMGMAVLPGMTAVLSWALNLSKALADSAAYMSGTLGAGAGIDTTKLNAGDAADVELTLKRIKELQGQTDASSAAELKTQQAHLEVLKQIAAGTWTGPKPWEKNGNPLTMTAPGNVAGLPYSGAYGTSGGISSGLGMVAGLGLPSVKRGTPYGQTYFGNEIHNGEDLFAPTGTAIDAPFAGFATTRWSNTTGHIIELIDATGQKLLLGHLNGYADGLEASIKAAGGKLLVKQGQLIGYVGQTGSLAHADLGPGNSHTHIMGYNAQGKIVDPLSLQFKGVAAGAIAPGGSPTDSEGGLSKSAASYLKEATRIQAAIDAAIKQGGPAGSAAYTAATKEMAAFTKGNKDAAAAVAYLGTQTKATAKIQTEATKDAAEIQKALSQGSVTDAQTALEKLKVIQQAQLNNAGDSLAKRLAVVKQTSGQIYQAELDIAEATRKAAYAGVADEKNPQVKAQQQASADKTYALAKQKAILEQAQALTSAQKAADSQADVDQKKAETERVARQKEANGIAQALRTQDVEKASGHLDALKQLRDVALQDAGDNVSKQLDVQRQYAAGIQAGAEAIANAQFKIDKAAAQSGPAQLKDGALIVAKQKRDAALAAARSTDSVDTATQKRTEAIRTERDNLHQLADSLRASITQGTFSEDQRQKAIESLHALDAEAKKYGLTNDKNIQQARDTVSSLIATATSVDKATAAYEAYWKIQNDRQNNEGMADAGMRSSYGLGQDGLTAALLGSGASPKLIDDPQAALAELDTFSKDAADRIRRVYADELVVAGQAAEQLAQDTEKTLTELNARISSELQNEMDAALEANTTFETLENQVRQIVSSGRDPNTTGFVQYLDGIIAKGGHAAQVAQQVKDDLDNLVNQALAPSLLDVLGNPEAYQDGAHGADGIANTGQGEGVTKFLQGQVDQQFTDGLKKLSDAELKLAENEAGAADHGDELVQILTEQKRRADEAVQSISKLAAIDLQSKTNTLDFQHGSGQLTDAQYAEQKLQLQRTATWQTWQDAQKAGGNMEVATAQLWADLLKLDQDGTLARRALATAAETKRQEAEKQEFQQTVTDRAAVLASNRTHLDNLHSFQLVSDRDFQAQREKQETDAAWASFDAHTTSLADLQEELTRITRQGVADRAAIEKSELEKFKSDVQGVEETLSSVFSAFGASSEQQQGISSLFNTVNSGIDAFGKFASGDILGGIESTVSAVLSLGDALMNLAPGFALWKKSLLDVAAAETAAMGSKTFGNIANPYYDKLQADSAALTTKANASVWQRVGWFLFGGAPETLSKAASDSLIKSSNLFSDYAQAINSSMESELMNAFDNADFTGVQDSLDKMFGKLEAGIALKSLISKSRLGADIQKLVDDTTAGLDTTADKAAIKADEGSITSQFQAIAPSFAGYGASATSTTGSSSTSGTTTFGSLPSVGQMAIPTQFIDACSLIDTASKRIDGASLRDEATAARNDATAARFEAAVGRISGSSSTPATLVLR